ncbi:Oxidoreductase molybdopterin binding domain [Geoglobus ahangari]|uniref:Oxidoreductase molybdopterin binding domain n=1 Tax=Geoglobus ahangari TaxID=113653 RepID=A0A0F7IG36_9EURY|nr:Oxidoreductase molybdopterin binding domain [Geoglobus ahangari]
MLPPGQKEIPDLPVLNVSSIPDVDISSYSLKVTGRVENSLTLTYDSLMEMERVEVEVPAHCVEGWSVLGIRWEGGSGSDSDGDGEAHKRQLRAGEVS